MAGLNLLGLRNCSTFSSRVDSIVGSEDFFFFKFDVEFPPEKFLRNFANASPACRLIYLLFHILIFSGILQRVEVILETISTVLNIIFFISLLNSTILWVQVARGTDLIARKPISVINNFQKKLFLMFSTDLTV